MKNIFTIILVLNSLISFSQDDISWNPSQNIASSSHGNFHPRITLDGSGNPIVIWSRDSDDSFYLSRWTGSSFTPPLKLNPSWMTVANASWMGPDIASKGDTVYVVMKRSPETSDSNHIYIMSSFNGGASFGQPVRVSYIADSLSRFPTVSIDDSGNPLVAFMKFNSDFAEARWVVSKSNDLGQSFLPDILASGWSGFGAEVCDCCPGALVSSGDRTAMVYRDNLSNKRDIWAGISTDNAETFEDGFAVDNGKWIINSCPASGPDAVIIGDSLYSVYMSGAAGSYRSYYSKSSINSKSLNKVYKVADNIPFLTEQNYPRIASNGMAAAIVWTQKVGGTSQLPILFTNDISKGFTSVWDTVDLNNITNTDVAIGKDKVYVVWQDDNSGTVKFRSGSFEPLLTDAKEPVSIDLKVYPNPATDQINIITNNNFINEMSIFDSMGRKVLQTPELNSTVYIKDYPTGMYFIRLISGSQVSIINFIKD